MWNLKNLKILLLVCVVVGTFFAVKYIYFNDNVNEEYELQLEFIEKLAAEFMLNESIELNDSGIGYFSLEDIRNSGISFDELIDPRCDKKFIESLTMIIVTIIDNKYSFEIQAVSSCDNNYIEDTDQLIILEPVVELTSIKDKYEVDDLVWGSSISLKIVYDVIEGYSSSYYYSVGNPSDYIQINDLSNEVIIDLDENDIIYIRTVIGTSVLDSIYILDRIDSTAPTSLIVDIDETSNSTITLIVDATDNETGIKSYSFSKDNGVTWTSAQDSNTYTFTNLSASTSYDIKVRVTNNVGLETISDTITTTTFISSQSPIIVDILTEATTDSITINVDATDDVGIRSYYYSYDNGLTWTSAQDSNSYTFSDLISGNTYYIRVKVENDVGLSTTSKYILTATIGSPPIINDITTTIINDSIIIYVSASDLPNSDFTGIDGYYYSLDDGISWTLAQDTNEYIFNDLSENTTYYIKVRITNRSGYEVISDSIIETTTDFFIEE